MQTLYDVRANHPVAKRVDELKLTEVDMNDLVAELRSAGYLDEDIDIDSNTYFEDGDIIYITAKFVIDNSEKGDFFRLMTYISEQKAKNTTDMSEDPLFIDKDSMFPLKGTLKNLRLDRSFAHLIVSWDIGDPVDGIDQWQQTNVHALEQVGFKFIQPNFETIPIMNADDNLLHEDELVVKYYALQNKISIEEAEEAIDKVRSAMGKHGIVFYRP